MISLFTRTLRFSFIMLTPPLFFYLILSDIFPALRCLRGKELGIKKSRYTDDQIAFALKQAETSTPGRSHSVNGNFGADVLSLEECVRRSQRRRTEAPEAG
ncbi:hypothetical protein SPHINGO391_70006 [Sphingomonas aurantiaca]|uniref:Uncharacterized protein n=1 Tax=Sphingomonas aurantiaca TaxID=185949 RepID=A0A5E8ALL0_9SPHN|nr:hypothetical protein SPHINGO391_70006 [Sphingomonas aurantiaca]